MSLNFSCSYRNEVIMTVNTRLTPNFACISIKYLPHVYNVISDVYIYRGAKVDWELWISDLVKNSDGTDILPLW